MEPTLIYTDNSQEFNKATNDLEYIHDTCTPHRPQTNGIAERAVRRVQEGTSCQLVQSGLNTFWWREAMSCFCFLFNILDIQIEAKHRTKYATANDSTEKSSLSAQKSFTSPPQRATLRNSLHLVAKLYLAYSLVIMRTTEDITAMTCGLSPGTTSSTSTISQILNHVEFNKTMS